jgi:predicted nuclease of predicted toxin-antitoxin system
MIVLLDMNLSPRWVDYLRARGIDAVHWSSVGDVCAEDRVIMAWAREHDHVVFTNDLDFTTLLAATGDTGPSVLQLRTQNVMPEACGEMVVRVLIEQQMIFEQGAFVTIDEVKARVRILPLRQKRGDEGSG